MTALKIGPEYEATRRIFLENIENYQKEINKTVDLFGRIKNTDQAEEVTTVLYAAIDLKKKNKDNVSEQEVLDYILNWKKTWDTKEKKKTVISAIRNLQMLSWLKLQYSESLPQEII